ncbi:MAG: RnfABCDGE type electron transport complex subunit D [Cyanobacteria bacterium]|nr:RnfABCDGE type electron transport complex subunit D [Cyanobacteriota bacterium]MDW8201883.1 RnfABCDGE type electron transport complex subunit D [Cyanobacteriota bacterium SKYGB_h_bin112]
MPAFPDARDYQILFLSLFLVLGLSTRDWTLKPEIIATAIVTCLVVQVIISHVVSAIRLPSSVSSARPSINVRSPLITALGLSLLFRTDRLDIMALAAGLAIASKFVFQFKGKHCFNPANFGIVATILLSHSGWVSPGQWGENAWYVAVFLATGGLVLQRVGRWDTSIAFLGVYGLLEVGRNLWLGWTWDVVGHRLMSGSLILFALFMVTDPRSIPNARIGRLLWAGAIAVLTFILRNYYFVSTAVFWALFALSPVTWLLDWWLPAERFAWRSSSTIQVEQQGVNSPYPPPLEAALVPQIAPLRSDAA